MRIRCQNLPRDGEQLRIDIEYRHLEPLVIKSKLKFHSKKSGKL